MKLAAAVQTRSVEMIIETAYARRPTFEKGDMWVVSEPAKNEFKPEGLKWL
jgi:hypothetical protein